MIKKVFFVAALSCGSVAFAQVHKMEHRDSTVTERTYNLNPAYIDHLLLYGLGLPFFTNKNNNHGI